MRQLGSLIEVDEILRALKALDAVHDATPDADDDAVAHAAAAQESAVVAELDPHHVPSPAQ